MPPIATELIHRGELTRWAKSGCEQSQQNSPLFDHLVGARKQLRRHGKAENLGRLTEHHLLSRPIKITPSFIALFIKQTIILEQTGQ